MCFGIRRAAAFVESSDHYALRRNSDFLGGKGSFIERNRRGHLQNQVRGSQLGSSILL
jgi:hypothetical protein